MLKAFKYRIYPTKAQAELISKHVGCCRFVYNLALETKQTAYVSAKVTLSRFDLNKQLPDLKKECEWLKEVNSQSLQYAISNLDNTFTAFFRGNASFPKFKKKTSRGSFGVCQSVQVDFKNKKLIIPKFKEGIDVVLHRRFQGTIKQATISITPTGKYFVSVLIETGKENKKTAKVKEKTTVGVDLGIASFAVTSTGEIFNNPKTLIKAQSRLKYIQRRYSKSTGKRTKHRLSILHERVANKRRDFLHKVSTKLIRENQSIALESLNVSGMVKNHHLAQAITDASWGTFVSMLEYKARWNGVNILRIGQFEPSSKMCSNCGSNNKDLQLGDREWTCENCGEKHDRDINAACNIKSFALKRHLSGEHRLKNQDELPTLAGVLTPEAPLPLGVG